MRSALLIAIVLVSGCLEAAGPSGSPTMTPVTTPTPTPSASPSPSPSPSPPAPAAVTTETEGLVLTAVRTGDDPLRVQAQAENRGGDATVRGGCDTPWRFVVMAANGSTLRAHEPRATCMGFTEEPFPDGATLNATFEWDGRAWDDAGHPSPAPEGEYRLVVSFLLRRGDAEERTEASLPFVLE